MSGEPPVHPGLDSRLIEFTADLRSAGVAVGTSELLDAFAVLEHVTWSDQEVFREALASAVAKSVDHRRVFDVVFDRFFFTTAEEQALVKQIQERGTDAPLTANQTIDLQSLTDRINEALQTQNRPGIRDLARLSAAAFGDIGVGVPGIDLQRIRRQLGLQHIPGDAPRHVYEMSRLFDRYLLQQLQHEQIQRSGKLPPSRPLSELQRALPTNPIQDQAELQRVITHLKRRLASGGTNALGRQSRPQVDVRRTMRASLQTGGVPVDIRYRRTRSRKPEIFIVCDVSTSVSSASLFFLSVVHALHDRFRKMRSFVFVERVSEVTELFTREKTFKEISRAISREAGVVDTSGHTDYGRVWRELHELIADELHPRATLIVLGDARTNGRDPGLEPFEKLSELAGHTYWLNPEPSLYWNYGDSVIATYSPFCETYECWSTKQLEQFVKTVTMR